MQKIMPSNNIILCSWDTVEMNSCLPNPVESLSERSGSVSSASKVC